MGQISLYFQPPLHWQQFEELTASVLKIVYDLPHVDPIGRPGQSQDGVDVYGKSSKHGRIGVQCKRLDERDSNNQPLPGGPITRKLLTRELAEARNFKHGLDLWILATTAKRDANAQAIVRQVNSQEKPPFVILWFWEDFITHLNNHRDLQRWYYADVLDIRAEIDQDRIILQSIADAFNRPAFSDRLSNEHLDDMTAAVSDTMKALRTGELVDRVTRNVIRKTIGGWRLVSDAAWRDGLRKLDDATRKLREELQEGIRSSKIVADGRGFLVVNDQKTAQELNNLRAHCLRTLNTVLSQASLPPV